MTDELKTSVRVVGERQVDEFRALCVLLGRRPHQLAADLVLEGIPPLPGGPAGGAAPRGDGRGCAVGCGPA